MSGKLSNATVHFSPLASNDGGDPVPSPIGPLRGVLTTKNGTVSFDFSKFRTQRISRTIALALDHLSPGWRKATAQVWVRSVRRFLEWLQTRNEVASAAGVSGIPAGLLSSYEQYRRSASTSSPAAAEQTAAVLLLIRTIHGEGIEVLPEDLLENARSIDGMWGSGTPVEPYDPFELRQLRAACLSELRCVLKREREGRYLLSQGADPEKHPAGWSLPNTLWFLRRNGPCRAHETGYSAERSSPSFIQAVRLIFPTSADFVVAALLLTLSTGIEPSCLRNLELDSLVEVRKHLVKLQYSKPRAGGDQIDFILSRGITGPWKVFQHVLRFSSALRAHADVHLKRKLFLVTSFGSAAGKVHLARWEAAHRSCGPLQTFSQRNQLRSSEGHPLKVTFSRLRKNFWSDSYLRATGHLRTAVRGRKTVDVGDESYFRIGAFTETHEQAIEAGLWSARNVQPRVLPVGDASAYVDQDDSFISKCLDPTDSPWAPQGELCPDQFLGCLFCDKATFLPFHLPALLQLGNHMLQQRSLLDELRWKNQWGRPFRQLSEVVLPQFSAAQILEAREIAAREAPLPYLPIRLRNVKP